MVGSCDVKFPIRLEGKNNCLVDNLFFINLNLQFIGLVLLHSQFSSYEPGIYIIYKLVIKF